MYRIGILVSQIDKGAAELLEVNLAVELSKFDLDVYLLTEYSSDKFEDKESEMRIQSLLANPIIRFELDYRFRFIRKLILIRSMKFDFIVSQNRGTDFISFLSSFWSRTKMIVAMHHVYNPSDLNSRGWRMWILILKFSRSIYHISKFSMQNNVRVLKLNPRRSYVIRNSVSIPDIKNKSIIKEFNIPENGKTVISVSRINLIKGADLNFDIIIPLLLKNSNLYYVYFGDFDDSSAFVINIKKRIEENGLMQRVFFAGYRNDVKQYIPEANALLHFTRKEAFGLTLLEAYLLGVPVITSNVEGIPELFVNTEITPIPLNSLDVAREKLNDVIGVNNNGLAKRRESEISKFSHNKRARRILSLITKGY